MITFRYALCIALATALSPLTASQDSRSYIPSRSGDNQAPTSVSYSSDSTSHTSKKRFTPFRTSLDDLDNDSGNESDNNKNSSSYIQYHSQVPVGHAANHDTSNNHNHASFPPSYVPQRHADMPVTRSYSTPSSSCEDLCEHMTPQEEDMFGLLKTSLSNYSDSDLLQRNICSLSIEEFTALAQKMASRVVHEKTQIARQAAGDDVADVTTAGIEALGTHQTLSHNAANRKQSLQDTDCKASRYEEEEEKHINLDEIKLVIEQTQADIELNVAQQLLPISFHWNILPTSHKCGVGAAVLFAGVGIYNTIKYFFGSKAPQYDPELVDAAVNQEAHA